MTTPCTISFVRPSWDLTGSRSRPRAFTILNLTSNLTSSGPINVEPLANLKIPHFQKGWVAREESQHSGNCRPEIRHKVSSCNGGYCCLRYSYVKRDLLPVLTTKQEDDKLKRTQSSKVRDIAGFDPSHTKFSSNSVQDLFQLSLHLIIVAFVIPTIGLMGFEILSHPLHHERRVCGHKE